MATEVSVHGVMKTNNTVMLAKQKDTSSIYHCHIEHFFTFLAGNTVFSLISDSPPPPPTDSSSCPWLGWVSFPLGFLCLMMGH